MQHDGKRIGRRRVFTAVVCGLIASVLGACGGSQGSVVATVNGAPITKAQADHAMSVVAASGSNAPGYPKFEVPRPPDYTACIAYFAKYPNSVLEPPRPTHAARKAKCEHEYRKELLKGLYFLVSVDWVEGEARELAVKVPSAALQSTIATFKRQSFPGGEGFRGYLASMRETLADLTMQLKQELLATAIGHKLNARSSMRSLSLPQRQAALERFERQYRRKWTQRTSCQPGYVVPICRQYRGSGDYYGLVPNAVPLTDLAAE